MPVNYGYDVHADCICVYRPHIIVRVDTWLHCCVQFKCREVIAVACTQMD